MNITTDTTIDLDTLLSSAPPPAQTERLPEPGAAAESEAENEPTLHRRLCDELVAKARLIGWSDAELARLSCCESDDELLAARERLSRELALRFAVPPLYPSQPPDSPHRFNQLNEYR